MCHPVLVIYHNLFPMLAVQLALIFFYCFIYLFLINFGCTGSSLLCSSFQLQQAGAALHCGAQPSHCNSFSCCGAQALGIRTSVIGACRLSCSVACGIFLDQGSNPCPLHWQVASYPLYHQGSPNFLLILQIVLLLKYGQIHKMNL